MSLKDEVGIHQMELEDLKGQQNRMSKAWCILEILKVHCWGALNGKRRELKSRLGPVCKGLYMAR